MDDRERVARAIAFFEASDDAVLLHRLVVDLAPRARKAVQGLMTRGGEEAIPPPADIRGAAEAASEDEALATLAQVKDFALLQALARAIGKRVEAIEIVASAEFPEGVRVTVPAVVAFPPSGKPVGGVVETTGTALTVRLDSGETWQGPPSLARLETKR